MSDRSAYARQFLKQMDKPDVDQIGVSPSISIDQRASATTALDGRDRDRDLRLSAPLYARIGIRTVRLRQRVEAQSPQRIVEAIEQWPDGTRIQVLGPVIRTAGAPREGARRDQQSGFVRVRVNGEVRDVSEDIDLERYKRHTIEVVVDRLIVRHFEDPESEEAIAARSRLTQSVETAMEMGGGVVTINDVTDPDNPTDHLFSEHLACVHGHVSLPEIEPRTFSFNSPHGACPVCQGLGVKREFDPELIVPNPALSVKQGVLAPWATGSHDSWTRAILLQACGALGIRWTCPGAT